MNGEPPPLLRLEWRDPKELEPNPANWRRHPASQEHALKDVLAEVGWAGALLWNEATGRLIDGHLRQKVADGPVPVLVGSWTEEQERLILATLDPIAAMASADKDVLVKLLGSIETESKGIQALLEAIANDERVPMPFIHGETDPDAVPEAPEESLIQRGDLWLLGKHRLLCGDSTSAEDMEKLMGGRKPQLLLTDPPYGIGIVKKRSKLGAEAVGHTGSGRPYPWRGVENYGRVGYSSTLIKSGVYYPITGDDKPFDPTHLLGLASKQIIFGANYFASKLPDGKAGIVWEKGAIGDFSPCELAWTSLEGRIHRYDYHWAGVVRKGPRAEELMKRIHPTQKPVGLFSMLLDDFSEKGDIILDPYLGSGTTIIAAERTGRTCYAMEIEPRYVQVSIERWQNYTGKKAEKLNA